MPQLGYWKIRGLAANIIYQMKYQNVDFELVEYEQGDAPDFSRATWMDAKFTLGLPFPNLPYFIDGDLKLTETIAIHKYIADKWNPELLGKDAQQRGVVNMLAGIICGDFKGAVTMPCYTQDSKEVVAQIAKDKMPNIVAFLGSNQFLAGNNVTWIDFYFLELLNLVNFVWEDLYTAHPTLKTYHDNVSNLPGLKEYLEDPDCREKHRTFNNKSAKINN